jgi:hypothetical protein
VISDAYRPLSGHWGDDDALVRFASTTLDGGRGTPA